MKEERMRELIPPMWPPDSFTMEEAMAAVKKVKAAREAREKAKGTRTRGSNKSVLDGEPTGGDDP
ncbi:MAG TPA: hypothetical protein VF647_12920 [Longimicrobium sp.]|jgi:hypothetical protein